MAAVRDAARRGRRAAGAHQRPRRRHPRADRRGAARARRGTCPKRSSSCRRSTCTRRLRRAPARASSKCRSGADFAFPVDADSRRHHAAHAAALSDQPEQPDRSLDPAEPTSCGSRGRRRMCTCSSTRRTPTSARSTLIGDPDIAALPNVFIGRTFAKAYGLAGVRAGALIGDRGDARAAPAHRAAVQPQRLRRGRARRLALRDTDYYEWYLAQVRTSKALLYEALEQAGDPLLAERRQLRARPASATARPRSSTAWRRAACTCATSRAIRRAPVACGSRPASSNTPQACIAALEEVLCGAA